MCACYSEYINFVISGYQQVISDPVEYYTVKYNLKSTEVLMLEGN